MVGARLQSFGLWAQMLILPVKKKYVQSMDTVSQYFLPLVFLFYFSSHVIHKTYYFWNLLQKILSYIAEYSEIDAGNFLPEFPVTGVLQSAASVVSGGNVQYFCHNVHHTQPSIPCTTEVYSYTQLTSEQYTTLRYTATQQSTSVQCTVLRYTDTPHSDPVRCTTFRYSATLLWNANWTLFMHRVPEYKQSP